MDQNKILENLDNDHNRMQVLRQIITLTTVPSGKWETIALKLEECIKENKIIGKESILLASQALFSLYANFDRDNLSERLISLLNCKTNATNDETLKLTITFGYLQLKDKPNSEKDPIHKPEICSLLFNIIQPHCVHYTKHSYFAHKVLYQWLVTTSKTNFWKNNSMDVENSLEEIIFSNWQNSIQDVAKHNSSKVFNLYLKMMNEKYEGFLEFALKKCIGHITWNHIIKYKLLTEICSLLPEKFVFDFQTDYLMEKLLNTVMVSHLQKASSNVFEMMTMKRIFKLDEIIKFMEKYIYEWREEENDESTYFVYKYILHKVFQINNAAGNRKYMLQHSKARENLLYDMYIQSFFSKEYDNKLSNYFYNFKDKELLNSKLTSDNQKAAYISLFPKSNLPEQFIIVHLLSATFTWANTESQHLRNEMIRNLDVLFNRIFKSADSNLYTFMLSNLYILIDHCLGIARPYQQKILGITIYKNMLRSTNGDLAYCYVYNNAYPSLTDDSLEVEYEKMCVNELIMRNRLFRLVLDPANDIRTMAVDLLISYFLTKPLSSSEIQLLKEKARDHSNSLNFYEAETAAVLIKLLYKWKAIDEDLQFWISEAHHQLINVKKDIYEATCNNKPFYGILIIILENFCNGEVMDEQNFTQLLNLLEDAVQFFTETLLTPIQRSEYASSVAGIGVAIQEAVQNRNTHSDDLSIRPEHRHIFTCMWRSLKATSEIAAEIATKSTSNENINRSCNIILTVLLKCYHKGAIKSTGCSLNRVCRHFCETNKITTTKNPFENQMKSLCEISKNNNEEVGFTIAFHRIVASDVRPSRPFLHYAMETLLTFLKKRLKSMNLGTDNECALPCVLQLNFLQTLIEDKQLLSSITIYLEDACLICLEYMQAKDFLIRNASLQWYGAIIPRLTGQIAAVDNDFGYGYSVCHFVTHYPQLSKYVLESLEVVSCITETRTINLESYSNISNILLLLSKLFVGSCEFTDYSADEYVTSVRSCLDNFLKSHVAYVRLLAAKVYVAFVGVPEMVQELVNLARLIPTLRNENELHGFLLAFTYLKAKITNEIKAFSLNIEHTQLLRFWAGRCHQLAKSKRPCFIVETLLLKNPEILYILGYLQLIDAKPLTTQELQSLILPKKLCLLPGFQEFVEEIVKQYCLNNNSWSNVEFIESLLTAPNHDYGLSFFKFANVPNNLDDVIKKINHVLNAISIHKTGQERLLDPENPISLFELLEPEVAISIATYKLFDRAWKYNHQKTKKLDTDIQFCKADINRLIEESAILKFFYETLYNFDTLGYNAYYALPDVYRKLYSDFILVGYKLNQKENVDLNYIFLISRDDVPEVRDTFRDQLEESIYGKIENECKFSGFCTKIQYNVIINMENNSNYLQKCEHILQLFMREIYECDSSCNSENAVTCYRDDISLFTFVNHLLDIRTKIIHNTAGSHNDNDYALKSALHCNVLRNENYYRSLKNSIDTADRIYVIQVHDFILNKLSEACRKDLNQ